MFSSAILGNYTHTTYPTGLRRRPNEILCTELLCRWIMDFWRKGCWWFWSPRLAEAPKSSVWICLVLCPFCEYFYRVPTTCRRFSESWTRIPAFMDLTMGMLSDMNLTFRKQMPPLQTARGKLRITDYKWLRMAMNVTQYKIINLSH